LKVEGDTANNAVCDASPLNTTSACRQARWGFFIWFGYQTASDSDRREVRPI